MSFLRIFFTPKLDIPSVAPFPWPVAPCVRIIRKLKSSESFSEEKKITYFYTVKMHCHFESTGLHFQYDTYWWYLEWHDQQTRHHNLCHHSMKVVLVIDRIYNCTMKSKLLPWKVCWLDFILRIQGEILREVQLDIFNILSKHHFRKNSSNIYVCSVFEIGITDLQQFITYVLSRFVVINASYSFIFAKCAILLCIWFHNTFIPFSVCSSNISPAFNFSRYLVSDSCPSTVTSIIFWDSLRF